MGKLRPNIFDFSQVVFRVLHFARTPRPPSGGHPPDAKANQQRCPLTVLQAEPAMTVLPAKPTTVVFDAESGQGGSFARGQRAKAAAVCLGPTRPQGYAFIESHALRAGRQITWPLENDPSATWGLGLCLLSSWIRPRGLLGSPGYAFIESHALGLAVAATFGPDRSTPRDQVASLKRPRG